MVRTVDARWAWLLSASAGSTQLYRLPDHQIFHNKEREPQVDFQSSRRIQLELCRGFRGMPCLHRKLTFSYL